MASPATRLAPATSGSRRPSQAPVAAADQAGRSTGKSTEDTENLYDRKNKTRKLQIVVEVGAPVVAGPEGERDRRGQAAGDHGRGPADADTHQHRAATQPVPEAALAALVRDLIQRTTQLRCTHPGRLTGMPLRGGVGRSRPRDCRTSQTRTGMSSTM